MMSDAIEVLGWTLLHFVWQGAIVGVLAATMLLALRCRSANARYLTAVSALSLMLLLPLATIAWIEQTPPVGEVSPFFNTISMIERPRTREDGTLALAETPIKVERIGIDFENPPPADAIPLIPVSDSGQTILEDLAEQRSASRIESYFKPFIPWAVAAWFIGVGVLSLRLLASWLSVQRLRRRATQPASENWQAMLRRLAERLRVTRPVQLVESALVEVPTVIGWLKPIILLPATAMTGLTTEQLEALLAHELAHVRRHDYLINLLQTVVETLLFYHPAVWWLSHRIRVEREHCCDDLAVQVCGDGLTYAKALVALEELRAPKLGLAMSSSGGSLLTRVARLLGQAEPQRRPTGWIAGLLSLVLLTMAGALGAGLLTPPEKPTAGLPNITQPTETKSTDTNEETSGPTQRQGQETRAVREEPEAEWGQEQNGLRTRLTLLSEDPVIGRLVVKVEVQNAGTKEQSWQWYARESARYFQIIGPDGEVVEELTSIMRSQLPRPNNIRPTQINPSETSVLLEYYSLSERFLLVKPGQYQIRFGRSVDGELAGKFKNVGDDIVPIPEPKPLTVQLGAGELPEIQAFALRIRKILPVRWGVGIVGPDEPRREDTAHTGLLFDPPDHGKNGELLVLGFFTEGTAPKKFEDKDVSFIDLGQTKLGRAHLVVTNLAKAAWPTCVEQIRAQLPEEDKADTDKPVTTAPLKSAAPIRKAAENLSRLVGRVRLKTEKVLPDLEKVELPPGKVLDESLVFSKEGGLGNVFVYLRKPTFKIEPPTEAEVTKPFVLIAEAGKFWPHAAIVRVSRPVIFENGAAEPMNFRTEPLRNNPLNVLVKMQDRFKTPTFEKSENIPISVKSNIKPWLLAHLLPLDHPFAAITDDDGRFTISGLPAGEHEFRVWHERVGWLEKSHVITIKPGEDAKSELEYAPERLKLTEAEVLAWGNRLIDTIRIPRAIVPQPAAPKKDDDAKAGVDAGLPTPPAQPTAGLPNDVQPSKPRSNDAPKTETSGPTPATVSGDPRRTQEVAQKSAAVARAEYEKVLESNRRVPGSIPETEVERVRLTYEKALLAGVRLAVEHAVSFLKTRQQEDGAWQGTPADGVTALCAAALLQAGVKSDDPTIQKALVHLRKVESTLSYTVALQTMVLCSASPKEDAELIRRNAAWLEKAQATEGPNRGAWSYMANNTKLGDGSCSRFAMLGLHAAKKAGFEVKAETWRNASDYWMTHQKKENHAWSYQPGSTATPSMTLSGMACLAIVNQHLPQDEQTKLRTEAIERAVPFVEPNAHLLWHSGHGGYALQCLERAAHLNRWPKFGKHELRKLIDEKLIGLQRPEGHWTGVGGSGGGFFAAPAEQTPEQKAAAEAAIRRHVQSDDLIATSFALMCLTGQPEPPRERQLRFEPREMGKKFQMRSNLIENSSPPMQRTEISGGVRIEAIEPDGSKWRIEADRVVIESRAREADENLEFATSSDVTRIVCSGSVKIEAGQGDQLTQATGEKLELDLHRNGGVLYPPRILP